MITNRYKPLAPGDTNNLTELMNKNPNIKMNARVQQFVRPQCHRLDTFQVLYID